MANAKATLLSEAGEEGVGREALQVSARAGFLQGARLCWSPWMCRCGSGDGARL